MDLPDDDSSIPINEENIEIKDENEQENGNGNGNGSPVHDIEEIVPDLTKLDKKKFVLLCIFLFIIKIIIN